MSESEDSPHVRLKVSLPECIYVRVPAGRGLVTVPGTSNPLFTADVTELVMQEQQQHHPE